jgi:CheY-like chemotaxis protein
MPSYNEPMSDSANPAGNEFNENSLESLSTVRLMGFSQRDAELLRLFLRRPPGSGTSLLVVDDSNADLLIANMAQPEAAQAVAARNRPSRTIGLVNQFSSTADFYQVQQNSQLLYSLAQGINRIREGWSPPHLSPNTVSPNDPPTASPASVAVSPTAVTGAQVSSLASPDAANVTDNAASNAGATGVSGAELPWQRSLGILVVDDSNFSRVAIQEALSKVGFAVDTAVDGEEGLRMATAKRYDVALIDFEMPGIKGPEVIRRMRGLGINTPQLLIMLTSRTGTVDRLRAKIAGCDAYLTKPTKMSEFVSVLSQFAAQGRLKRS